MESQQDQQQACQDHLVQGMRAEVSLPELDLSGNLSSVKAWWPCCIKELSADSVLVEVEGGYVLRQAREQVRPPPPDSYLITDPPPGQLDPGKAVQVERGSAWCSALVCKLKAKSVVVLDEGIFSYVDLKGGEWRMREAVNYTPGAPAGLCWQPGAPQPLTIEFATEGRAGDGWQDRLQHNYKGVEQKPADYPTSRLAVPQWEDATRAPGYLTPGYVLDRPKFVVRGVRISGMLPPSSTSSFWMACVTEAYRQRAAAGTRAPEHNFQLPEELWQRVKQHLGLTDALLATAARLQRVEPQHAAAAAIAAAAADAVGVAAVPAGVSLQLNWPPAASTSLARPSPSLVGPSSALIGRLGSPKRGRDPAATNCARRAGGLSILGGSPSATQGMPAPVQEEETQLQLQQTGSSSPSGAVDGSAGTVVFIAPYSTAAAAAGEGTGDETGERCSQQVKKIKPLQSPSSMSSARIQTGMQQQQHSSRAEPMLSGRRFHPAAAAAAVPPSTGGHGQQHSTSTQHLQTATPQFANSFPALPSSHPEAHLSTQASISAAAGTQRAPATATYTALSTPSAADLQLQPGASHPGQQAAPPPVAHHPAAFASAPSLASWAGSPQGQVYLQQHTLGRPPAATPASSSTLGQAGRHQSSTQNAHSPTMVTQTGLNTLQSAGSGPSSSTPGSSGGLGTTGHGIAPAALLGTDAGTPASAAPAAAAAAEPQVGLMLQQLVQHLQQIMQQQQVMIQQQHAQQQAQQYAQQYAQQQQPGLSTSDMERILQLVHALQVQPQAHSMQSLMVQLERCQQLRAPSDDCRCRRVPQEGQTGTMEVDAADMQVDGQAAGMEIDGEGAKEPCTCRACLMAALHASLRSAIQ